MFLLSISSHSFEPRIKAIANGNVTSFFFFSSLRKTTRIGSLRCQIKLHTVLLAIILNTLLGLSINNRGCLEECSADEHITAD